MNRLFQSLGRWIALRREVRFWRHWLSIEGGTHWRQDYRERLDPDRPLQGHVSAFVDRIAADTIRILDVGAGPLTKLGKKHPSKKLEITAIDVLATSYDRLLRKLKIEPLVRTIYADAERLEERFGADRFDIVHGQNCIDHTSDPIRAIREMIAVTRPGGFVILYHAENEGQREGYRDVHRWDFACAGESFVIRDSTGRERDVTKELASSADVECRRVADGSAVAIPHGDPPKARLNERHSRIDSPGGLCSRSVSPRSPAGSARPLGLVATQRPSRNDVAQAWARETA
jgi:SAM-dependent methyltransferase